MKKQINKKVITIVTILVVVVAIAGVFYIKNKPAKSQASATSTNPATATVPAAETATVTVKKASFGSVVNVTLTDSGKKQYKDAVKYRVYYDGKPITPIMALGKPTTAFPVRKVNDKVVVKLSKADGKEAYSVDLKLKEETKSK